MDISSSLWELTTCRPSARYKKRALCRIRRTGVDLVEDGNVSLQHRQLQDLIPFFLAACGLGACLCSCAAAAHLPRLRCERHNSNSQCRCPAVASAVLNIPEQAHSAGHGGWSKAGCTREALVDVAIQEGAVHFERLQLWHEEAIKFQRVLNPPQPEVMTSAISPHRLHKLLGHQISRAGTLLCHLGVAGGQSRTIPHIAQGEMKRARTVPMDCTGMYSNQRCRCLDHKCAPG